MIKKIKYSLWIIGTIFASIFIFGGRDLTCGWIWCGCYWAGILAYIIELIKEKKERENE